MKASGFSTLSGEKDARSIFAERHKKLQTIVKKEGRESGNYVDLGNCKASKFLNTNSHLVIKYISSLTIIVQRNPLKID